MAKVNIHNIAARLLLQFDFTPKPMIFKLIVQVLALFHLCLVNKQLLMSTISSTGYRVVRLHI